MNDHAVSTEPGGYVFTFSVSRTWLRTAGACAVIAAAIVAVLANAPGAFRVPLGIALGVLVMTLLITYAVNHSSSTQQPATAQAARTGRHIPVPGRIRGSKSLAAELALLAELHAKGALSDEEFVAAKRHILKG